MQWFSNFFKISTLRSPKIFFYHSRSFIFKHSIYWDDSSDGRVRVVRVSASRDADLGLIPSGVKPVTLTLVFTASLLDAQY